MNLKVGDWIIEKHAGRYGGETGFLSEVTSIQPRGDGTFSIELLTHFYPSWGMDTVKFRGYTLARLRPAREYGDAIYNPSKQLIAYDSGRTTYDIEILTEEEAATITAEQI